MIIMTITHTCTISINKLISVKTHIFLQEQQEGNGCVIPAGLILRSIWDVRGDWSWGLISGWGDRFLLLNRYDAI